MILNIQKFNFDSFINTKLGLNFLNNKYSKLIASVLVGSIAMALPSGVAAKSKNDKDSYSFNKSIENILSKKSQEYFFDKNGNQIIIDQDNLSNIKIKMGNDIFGGKGGSDKLKLNELKEFFSKQKKDLDSLKADIYKSRIESQLKLLIKESMKLGKTPKEYLAYLNSNGRKDDLAVVQAFGILNNVYNSTLDGINGNGTRGIVDSSEFTNFYNSVAEEEWKKTNGASVNKGGNNPANGSGLVNPYKPMDLSPIAPRNLTQSQLVIDQTDLTKPPQYTTSELPTQTSAPVSTPSGKQKNNPNGYKSNPDTKPDPSTYQIDTKANEWLFSATAPMPDPKNMSFDQRYYGSDTNNYRNKNEPKGSVNLSLSRDFSDGSEFSITANVNDGKERGTKPGINSGSVYYEQQVKENGLSLAAQLDFSKNIGTSVDTMIQAAVGAILNGKTGISIKLDKSITGRSRALLLQVVHQIDENTTVRIGAADIEKIVVANFREIALSKKVPLGQKGVSMTLERYFSKDALINDLHITARAFKVKGKDLGVLKEVARETTTIFEQFKVHGAIVGGHQEEIEAKLGINLGKVLEQMGSFSLNGTEIKFNFAPRIERTSYEARLDKPARTKLNLGIRGGFDVQLPSDSERFRIGGDYSEERKSVWAEASTTRLTSVGDLYVRGEISNYRGGHDVTVMFGFRIGGTDSSGRRNKYPSLFKDPNKKEHLTFAELFRTDPELERIQFFDTATQWERTIYIDKSKLPGNSYLEKENGLLKAVNIDTGVSNLTGEIQMISPFKKDFSIHSGSFLRIENFDKIDRGTYKVGAKQTDGTYTILEVYVTKGSNAIDIPPKKINNVPAALMMAFVNGTKPIETIQKEIEAAKEDKVPDQFTISPVFAAGGAYGYGDPDVKGYNTATDIETKADGDYPAEYSLDGGTTWTTQKGKIDPKINPKVRLKASDTSGGKRSMTLTIGGVSAKFEVTTLSDTVAPEFVSSSINGNTYTQGAKFGSGANVTFNEALRSQGTLVKIINRNNPAESYDVSSQATISGSSLILDNVTLPTLTQGGDYYLDVTVYDLQGNPKQISNPSLTGFKIEVNDATAPNTPTTFVASGNNSEETGYTQDGTINLNIADVTDPSGVFYYVSESATPPLANAQGWSATKPTTYTFTDVTKRTATLYVFVKDGKGNVQQVPKYSTIEIQPGIPAKDSPFENGFGNGKKGAAIPSGSFLKFTEKLMASGGVVSISWYNASNNQKLGTTLTGSINATDPTKVDISGTYPSVDNAYIKVQVKSKANKLSDEHNSATFAYETQTEPEPIDTTPDAYDFTDVTGAGRGANTPSNIITVSGVNAATPISITGGRYLISTDGGTTWSAATSSAGTVYNGNKVKLEVTANGSYGGDASATVNIGGVTDTFKVTTESAPANNAPTASPYTFSNSGTSFGVEKTIGNIVTLANANDADGDTLTPTIKTQGSKGTFALTGNVLKYTPNAGQTGIDNNGVITFSDGKGGTKDVVITVENIDSVVPTSAGTFESMETGETKDISLTFTKNLTSATITVNSGKVNGKTTGLVAGTDYTISGTTLTLKNYEASSTAGTYSNAVVVKGTATTGVQSADVNVEVEVVESNTEPTANNFTFNNGGTAFGIAKTFNWKTLSAADDEDGDPLTASVKTQGTKGTFSVSGDNVTYTPNAGQTGTDTGVITIDDGNGGTKDVTITVQNIDSVVPTSAGTFELLTVGSEQDISISFTKNLASSTITVNNGTVNGKSTGLVAGTDYTISGTTLTLKKYKAPAIVGTYNGAVTVVGTAVTGVSSASVSIDVETEE